jgi:uncharacterized protein DUF3891
MIIRRTPEALQLITQPQHAALAARIMRMWDASHFPESPRKASILRAVAHHDDGWADVDESLVLDEATGQLVDFIEVSDAIKRETSSSGIDRLAGDPYAAALVAQHRLHVYRRYADNPAWNTFFADVTAARDRFLCSSGSRSLEELLDDYKFVRAGDLVSLAFCNNWPDTDGDGCGYGMHLDGTSMVIIPDPFGGQTIDIEIEAREIDQDSFASADEARRVFASAPIVKLRGHVTGG